MELFGGRNRKMVQNHQKALPTQRFRNAFPERQKPYKTNGK